MTLICLPSRKCKISPVLHYDANICSVRHFGALIHIMQKYCVVVPHVANKMIIFITSWCLCVHLANCYASFISCRLNRLKISPMYKPFVCKHSFSRHCSDLFLMLYLYSARFIVNVVVVVFFLVKFRFVCFCHKLPYGHRICANDASARDQNIYKIKKKNKSTNEK